MTPNPGVRVCPGTGFGSRGLPHVHPSFPGPEFPEPAPLTLPRGSQGYLPTLGSQFVVPWLLQGKQSCKKPKQRLIPKPEQTVFPKGVFWDPLASHKGNVCPEGLFLINFL